MGITSQAELMADISDYQITYNAQRYARAGRRAIMLKAADANTPNGAEHYPARADASHALNLIVVHYVIVRFDVSPLATIDFYLDRIRPHWRKGDRMLIDVEEYSGHPAKSPGWVETAQLHLAHCRAPRAWGYTNESYMQEAGRQLANTAPFWLIAAYDGMLLGPGTPKLPRFSKTQLAGKQYTDGLLGAQPHVAPGIGSCDDTILTAAGQRELFSLPAPKLRRPLHAKLPHRKVCC